MAKNASNDSASMREVEVLLDALCGKPPKPCPKCGRPMTHRSAILFSSEGKKSWTIPLPICSHCDPAGQKLAVA